MTKLLLTLSLFILIQCFFLTPAYAYKTLADCEKKTLTSEKFSRCLDDVKKVLERELQTWVNNHIFNLEDKALETGRYAALKMFKRSQSDFITFRDSNCRWQYLAISPAPSADIVYKKCFVMAIQSRITELSQIQ